MKEMTLLELIKDARLEIPKEHFEKILESAKKLVAENDSMLQKIAFAKNGLRIK
jgi:hypothetical protein